MVFAGVNKPLKVIFIIAFLHALTHRITHHRDPANTILNMWQSAEGDKLTYTYESERLDIQPWGPNAVRVRAWQTGVPRMEDWALSEQPADVASSLRVQLDMTRNTATLTNGKMTVCCSPAGKLTFTHTQSGKTLLEECVRQRREPIDPTTASALELDARTFKPHQGTCHYHITARFEATQGERIYGMGQYQQTMLNVKGCDLELAQRNSQASVPFYTSSLGYGFLWNNPAVGRATFCENVTTFEAYSTTMLDYWIVAGDSPAEIVEAYAGVTGRVPMMPEYGLGFWQCKLRYQTQDELMTVARTHVQKYNLPLNVIVADFFHWPLQGDWRFDEDLWPDVKGMVQELDAMGVKLMVSIWPTVDRRSENFDELRKRGYLMRTEAGVRTSMNFCGECQFVDFTNLDARKAVWDIVKRNYHDRGVHVFWLDEAEPEFAAYSYEHYRYSAGSCLEVGNAYPVAYARAFYEGQLAAGQTDICNLARCAWSGSQKFGTLIWSGDIASSWYSMRCQLSAGLNMGMCGLPWWTTDIGGFHGGDPRTEEFRELFVRWFQWATYCPVMRNHGAREPVQPKMDDHRPASQCPSYAPNEVWSYGEEVLQICSTYIRKREELRPYTRSMMQHAHQHGTPVMRTMFYVFASDEHAWTVEDQYMYGDKYLVAPVMSFKQRLRNVYLPLGQRWTRNGTTYEGGQTIEAAAPLNEMPVYERVM